MKHKATALALAVTLIFGFSAARADYVYGAQAQMVRPETLEAMAERALMRAATDEQPQIVLPETIEVLEERALTLSDVAYVQGTKLSLSGKAEKVVTLENGVLTPVKAGEAVLTASLGEETAKAAIRVLSAEDAAKKVLELVNAERKAAGAKALKLSDSLNQVAAARAQELLSYYSHTRPDGRDFTTSYAENKAKYGYKGENIASGQLGPSQVTRDWLGLKGHRANIIYPKFTHMGLAYSITPAGQVRWVQVFGG